MNMWLSVSNIAHNCGKNGEETKFFIYNIRMAPWCRKGRRHDRGNFGNDG